MIKEILYQLYLAVGYSWMFFCIVKDTVSYPYSGLFDYLFRSIVCGVLNCLFWPISMIVAASKYGKSGFRLYK